jgi:NAD(P)-dependent dehydrogenase (short-subunit alcohol dehydrogenase family)/catechol 2,3-dioxygenase-like lactoylglutathione lyase family enzyme
MPTALITGASRGLGLALARALAESGWTLIIDARGAEALEAARAELAARTQVVALVGDVTDPAHRRALASAAADLGGLDALVNNASILGPSPQPNLLDYPLDELRAVYEANTVAPLALIQAAAPALKPGTRVVNITSDAAVEPYEGWGGYGSSKAALEQLSHILAAERPDWRVYWVDPGDMRTEMHQAAFPGEDISDRPLPEVSVPGLLALLTSALPSGRYQARGVLTPAPDGAGNAGNAELRGERGEGSLTPEPGEAGLAATPAGRGGAETGIRELRVALTVSDFERALRLYRDGFGLDVVKEWDSPEGRGAVLAAGRGTIELLNEADSAYTDSVEAGRRVSGPVRLALEVADVRAAAERLLAHGAEAVADPVHTTWGDLNQRLHAPEPAPSGMQLSLFQLTVEGPESPEVDQGQARD